jgi:UDP:flavonoid glycosyltransferase YjiC (YdhE family)
MPTALFFPSYLGSGFGHVSRCLALAEELHNRGWHTHFALAGAHADRVRRAGHAVHEPRRPFRPKAETSAGPAFTLFSDMNFQLARDRFLSPRIVRASVRETQRLLKRVRPDVLVGDTWPLTSIVGRLAGLPVAQIVKSVVHPAAPRLIWWQEPPPGLVSPDPRPVFNPALRRYGLPEIRRAEDLLVGDLLLVPGIPELDPLPEDVDGRTHYVGALTMTHAAAAVPPPWFDDLAPNRPLVYVTIGGGAGPVGGRDFFAAVGEALAGADWQGVVSTGAKFSPSELPPPPPNVRLEAWLPGPAVIARADVVLFHGGYGTTMETVRYGTPGVVLPFHSEQEANGRRLEASGAARVLLPSREPFRPAPGRWRGGSFVVLVQLRSDLTAGMLRQALASVLEDASYRQNARRLSQELAGYGGPGRAADLIENLVI